MSHLSLEALARLLDEEPTTTERRHLEGCAACRTELEALRADLLALGELPDLLPPPPGAWSALAERLHEEGLVSTSMAQPRRSGRHFLRLAAALSIFLSGAAAGFLARGAGGAGAGGTDPVASAHTQVEISPGAPVGSSLAARSSLSGRPPGYATISRDLEEAEAAYRAALARYAEFTGEDLSTNPIARLAALENIVISTRDALAAAPADPLINGYHMAALAQRDATVRQIAFSGNDRWY